jgi:hypothetical protein
LLKLLFWLVLEAIFNLIGIDDLVDYSEFLAITSSLSELNPSVVYNQTNV